ncbi:MAG TPA: Gfo/Idh/MocA family oxidoreductase [Polyangia bacterium]|nr:Gfo/Idh/MocA family oxidoreductase [Polyangia bacterium]
MTATVGVALVGAGPWGMTLGRAAAGLPNVDLRWICELNQGRRQAAAELAPSARLTAALDEALADRQVDAVLVAVDSPSHHAVGRLVLEADRHLLVEKPMAMTVTDAADLSALAAARRRILSVGHLLLHHPAVLHARHLIQAGELGQTLWLESARLATGAARSPGGAWWTLAPHDVSLALYFFDAVPERVTAVGRTEPGQTEETVVWATLHFADGRLAHIHVGRHAPAKQRAFTVTGTKRSLVVDELRGDRQVVLSPARGQAGGFCEVIEIGGGDALRGQCVQFISAVSRQDLSSSNREHALDVVKVLEAGAESMRRGGAPADVAA